jgi:hypothetical protein
MSCPIMIYYASPPFIQSAVLHLEYIAYAAVYIPVMTYRSYFLQQFHLHKSTNCQKTYADAPRVHKFHTQNIQ